MQDCNNAGLMLYTMLTQSKHLITAITIVH